MKETLQEYLGGITLLEEYLPKIDNITHEVYHYTSTDAFNSILFSNPKYVTLHASRYDCLNDTSEGEVAKEAYAKVCDTLLNEGKINDEQYHFFKSIEIDEYEIFTENIGDTIEAHVQKFDTFVCSFSKDNDSLSMWNYYGKNGGYNVGFHLCELDEHCNGLLNTNVEKKEKTCDVVKQVCPVVYEEKEQTEIIYKNLSRIIDRYGKEKLSGISGYISMWLRDWSILFKKECFKHENEIRIIVKVPRINSDQKIHPSLKIKYKHKGAYTVPYVELKFEKNVISGVTFSPMQLPEEQREKQKTIMKEMLKSHGFGYMNIDVSDVPVRF